MSDNISELFGKSQDDTPSDEPNYTYTIEFRDGSEPVEAMGYIIVNQLFYGVARGEGILYHVWPTELVKSVTNNGPVSSTMN